MFVYLYGRRLSLYLFAFLTGIALHSIFPAQTLSLGFWLALICTCSLSPAFIKNCKIRKVFFLSAFALALGLWRFDVSLSVPGALTATNDFTGSITAIRRGFYSPEAIVVLDRSGIWQPGPKIQINLKQDLPIGARVKFSCVMKPQIKQEDESWHEYYMWLHRARGKCSPAQIQIIAPPGFWDFRDSLYRWRQKLTARIAKTIPGDDGMLIAGVLYGERGMTSGSLDLFRRAGLTHIIAVSGSNMMIIVTLIFSVFLGLGFWRRQAFWLTLIAIFGFTAFVGISASVLRAAAMGALILLSRHCWRLTDPRHLLLVAASLLCFIDPWMLFFDAGFALSFLATVGLIYGAEPISGRLTWMPKFAGLREAAATTFSASLMTMPYVALIFSKLSLAGLITNLIAVPLVPWLMLFGAGSVVTAGTVLQSLFSLPATGISRIIFYSAGLVKIFPWLDINIANADLIICLATYALIIRFLYLLRQDSSICTKK